MIIMDVTMIMIINTMIQITTRIVNRDVAQLIGKGLVGVAGGRPQY